MTEIEIDYELTVPVKLRIAYQAPCAGGREEEPTPESAQVVGIVEIDDGLIAAHVYQHAHYIPERELIALVRVEIEA